MTDRKRYKKLKKSHKGIIFGVCIGAAALFGLYKLFNTQPITPRAESELRQSIGDGVSNAGLGYFTLPKGQEGTDYDGKKYRIDFHDADFSAHGGKIISENEIIMPMSVTKGGKTLEYYVRVRGHELVSITKKGMAGGGCSSIPFHMPTGIKNSEKERTESQEQPPSPKDTRDYSKAREMGKKSFGLWEKGVVPYSDLDEITHNMGIMIDNHYDINSLPYIKRMFSYNPRLASAALQVLCEKNLEESIQEFYPKDFNHDGTEDLAVLVGGNQLIFLTSRSDGFQINNFEIKTHQCEYSPSASIMETAHKFKSESEFAMLGKLRDQGQVIADWADKPMGGIDDLGYCITFKEYAHVNESVVCPVFLEWFYVTRDNQYCRLEALMNPDGVCHTPEYIFGGLKTSKENADELAR